MSDSKWAGYIIIFMIVGFFLFRDAFHWIWLILGIGFFITLITYHFKYKV